MKKFKFIIVALTISLFTLSSCTDNDPVTGTDPQAQATESIALRTVFNALKTSDNTTSGRSVAEENPQQGNFCFDFVYPITLSYNTGATVTVDSFESLIQILIDETNEVYIEGIVFPFDVIVYADNTTVTINSEEDLIEVLESCSEFDVWDDEDVIDIACFEFVYPIDLIAEDGTTVTINSDDELYTFFEAQGMYYEPDFVYPFTVTTIDGSEITIESFYDLLDLMGDCYAYDGWEDDCQCTQEYAPVCVYDSEVDMTIPFPNECSALCAGFDEDDFVDCGDFNYGDVFFMDYVGTCFDFNYPIQVDFNGTIMWVTYIDSLTQFFAPGNESELVFPLEITVEATGEVITINSEEELEEIISENCL